MRRAVLAFALLASCIRSDLVTCGEQLCPVDQLCTPGGCAAPSDVEACTGLLDGDVCSETGPERFCVSGACRDAQCGDGVVNPNEQCDDGNQRSADGCSGDCQSTELCGNEYVDGPSGEQCDSGIAGLSGDGCTSTCTIETDAWVEIPVDQLSGRSSYAMAYDSHRQRIVLFGGSGDVETFDETWEWDGSAWLRRTPSTRPPKGFGMTAAYDEVNKRMIMFGGAFGGVNFTNDTWAWDGVDWTLLQPLHRPPARIFAGLVFDVDHSCIVLHGGNQAFNVALADTWIWNGSDWIEQTPMTVPPARTQTALAFDRTHQQTVRFGGIASNVANDETWIWNGTDWTLAAPSVSPPPQWNAVLGYSPGDAGLIMTGGRDTTGQRFEETWFWNGETWLDLAVASPTTTTFGVELVADRDGELITFSGTDLDVGTNPTVTYAWTGGAWELRPQDGPPGRYLASLAFDIERSRAVLHGGYVATGAANDTWELVGTTWIQRDPQTPPPPLPATMAYDEARHQMVLFSSIGSTWLYADGEWEVVVPSHSPPSRELAKMAYDSEARVTLLVGGRRGAVDLDDIWAWDGTDWTELLPTVRIPPTEDHALAFDRRRNRLVLYGGTGTAGQTWEWDGTTWTQMMGPSPTPTTRTALAYDPVRQRTLLFGGLANSYSRETWEWDGAVWRRRVVPLAPSPRQASTATYDVASKRVLLVGGVAGNPIGDTWVYGFSSSEVPPDQCGDMDTDADQLVGCADPDCWHRCKPYCPPGTSCDSMQPHCGDGVCSSIEDYLVCATDCMSPP